VISANTYDHAISKCKEQCNGCKGFFYQKHSNGHQICGFYSKEITGTMQWHGHAEGAVCKSIALEGYAPPPPPGYGTNHDGTSAMAHQWVNNAASGSTSATAGSADSPHTPPSPEGKEMAEAGKDKTENQYLDGCCLFPQNDWGADVTADTFDGLSNDGAQGLSFTASVGDYVTFNAATPTMIFKCGKGEVIKATSDICGALPISDASEAWNAIGFEGSPSITATLFGFEFDLLGEMQSWQEMDDDDKVKLDTTKQKIGNYAANIPDPGDTALCFAFQAGIFAGAGCSMGFAFAQSGFLVATCSLSPASLIVCPGIEGAPEITFELLNFGFSPWRDLEQEAFIAFWNGNGRVADALAGTPITFKGVLSMMGSISFNAFSFTIGGSTFEVGVTMTVAFILDIVMPSWDDVKAVFTQLTGGDFSGILSGQGLPGFQITISGEVTFTCDLEVFALEFTPGSAGLTLGFNMDSEYSGFSNGLYMAARFVVTLVDLVPPLGNDFFKCNGRNVFEEISGERAAALFMSTTAGIGFGMEFTLTFIGNSLNVGFVVTHERIALDGSLSFSIGSVSLTLGVELGATFSGSSFSPYITLTNIPSLSQVMSAIGSACEALWNSLLDTIKGWFWIAHEEFVQWKNARMTEQKADGITIRPVPSWSKANSKAAAKHVDKGTEELFAAMAKSKTRKLLAAADPQSSMKSMASVNEKTKDAEAFVTGIERKGEANMAMNVNGKLQRQKWFPHIHHRHHRHHWHHRHHRHHWHHRHHRHHWHHRHIFEAIVDAVVDTWNSVTDWWANAAPGLIFRVENNEFEVNICAVKFNIRIRAGAKFFGTEYTTTFGFKVDIKIGDVVQAIKDAVVGAFSAIKNTVTSAFGGEMRRQYLQAEELELQRRGIKWTKKMQPTQKA